MRAIDLVDEKQHRVAARRGFDGLSQLLYLGQEQTETGVRRSTRLRGSAYLPGHVGAADHVEARLRGESDVVAHAGLFRQQGMAETLRTRRARRSVRADRCDRAVPAPRPDAPGFRRWRTPRTDSRLACADPGARDRQQLEQRADDRDEGQGQQTPPRRCAAAYRQERQ
jgi:hypothetical protein